MLNKNVFLTKDLVQLSYQNFNWKKVCVLIENLILTVIFLKIDPFLFCLGHDCSFIMLLSGYPLLIYHTLSHIKGLLVANAYYLISLK